MSPTFYQIQFTSETPTTYGRCTRVHVVADSTGAVAQSHLTYRLKKMMLRSAKFGSVARRGIATLPDNVNLNHPKIGIVKNILKLRRIAAATCETTLKAALTDPVTIEQVMTQPELTKYEMLLVCGTNKIYHAPFVKNPNVWQNFGWGRLINHEMRKTVNYGFFLGFV